jgi:hypothetical protein
MMTVDDILLAAILSGSFLTGGDFPRSYKRRHPFDSLFWPEHAEMSAIKVDL